MCSWQVIIGFAKFEVCEIISLYKDYALYSDLFKRKGDLSRARENLIKAVEIFKECGADGWVEKYERGLG